LLVAQHLLRGLEQAQGEGRMLGEVVVVPVANPIGLNQHLNGRLLGRFDFEGTGNFNRGFPELAASVLERLKGCLSDEATANAIWIRQALCAVLAKQRATRETEALKLALLRLAIDADFVFDLHCDGEALLHLYASRWQADEARALGAELGAAAILLEKDPGGNPFDEACAGPWWKLREALAEEGPVPLACFATTVELRGQADVSDDLAAADAAALLRFLQRRGIVAGEPGPLPEPRCEPTPLEGVDVLVAPAAGVLVYRKRLGEHVAAGEIVAELVDPMGEPTGAARTPMQSATDGLLFARMTERLARPGQKFCKVAGREPLSHRQAGKLLED
jgi:predicted deacylase